MHRRNSKDSLEDNNASLEEESDDVKHLREVFDEIEKYGQLGLDGQVSIHVLRHKAPLLFHRLGLMLEVSLGQLVRMIAKVDKAGTHNDRLNFAEFQELVKMLRAKCRKIGNVSNGHESTHDKGIANGKTEQEVADANPELLELFERLDT